MLPTGIIVLGLVQGALAGLNTLALVLLWRTTRVVNLAQPAMGMVAGVLVGLLIASGGWSFWWAAPVGIAVGAVLGLLSERLVLGRLQDLPRVVLLVATVGLAHVFGALHSALPFMFEGRSLPSYTIELGVTFDLFPVRLLGPHIVALVSLPVAYLFLNRFLHHTRVGLAALALGQDAQRARALGVPAASVRAAVWAVAGGLGALSGTLSIPVMGFQLGGTVPPTVLLLALAPAVIVGLRSLGGAALAALAVGVGYQACLWWGSELRNVALLRALPLAGLSDLFLAALIVVAIGVQGRRLGRAEAAARASSWEAAATPRPLPWAVARSSRVRVVAVALVAAATVAAALIPRFLSPRSEVLYATSAALALAALAVAVAWMLAGEISLGHWGLAGLGAAVAAFMPGPWPLRCLVAGTVMLYGGALLGLASRRQSSLGFAVLSLSAAVAAGPAVLAVGGRTVMADPGVVGAVTASLLVLTTAGVMLLRNSPLGVRMVAARDDPQRAPGLGADPLGWRVIAISLSTGLAGLAGALYLTSTPAGIAPGAFDPQVSLDVLAMAVIGGLGSPVGAVLGAIGLQSARLLLPGPWGFLASGAGILFVVLMLPGGLGRGVGWLRTRAVRLLVPSTVPVADSVAQPREPVGTT